MKLSLVRTRAALEAYDAARAAFDAACGGGPEKPPPRALSAGGGDDHTSDRNDRATAIRQRPDAWLRGLVAEYP